MDRASDGPRPRLPWRRARSACRNASKIFSLSGGEIPRTGTLDVDAHLLAFAGIAARTMTWPFSAKRDATRMMAVSACVSRAASTRMRGAPGWISPVIATSPPQP